MKGIYFQRKTNENPHVAEYKSLYINYDKNMWHLVIWMSLHIAMLAKLVGKISNCLFAGRLRWAGIAALIPLIYLCQYNFTSFAKCVLWLLVRVLFTGISQFKLCSLSEYEYL